MPRSPSRSPPPERCNDAPSPAKEGSARFGRLPRVGAGWGALRRSPDPTDWRPAFGAASAGATAYHGHAGLRRYWRDAAQIWERFHFEPERLLEREDDVAVLGRGSGRGRGSGVEVDQPFAMRFRLRGHKITFGQTYVDPARLAPDAGASEGRGA
jgi:ketosteroid isomerase-like protein